MSGGVRGGLCSHSPPTTHHPPLSIHHSGWIEPRVLARLVDVAFVPLVLVDADLRRVVRARRGALELAIEAADGRGRIGAATPAGAWRLVLARRHARHHGNPLLRGGLEERRAGHLSRERL